jgi:hypothetical protein
VVAVSLTNVWVQTAADGLVRADQVVGIDAHHPGAERETGALAARRGATGVDRQRHPGGLGVTVAHRTLIQTAEDPGRAGSLLKEWRLVEVSRGQRAVVVRRPARRSPS